MQLIDIGANLTHDGFDRAATAHACGRIPARRSALAAHARGETA
jgi:hypothetical protein